MGTHMRHTVEVYTDLPSRVNLLIAYLPLLQQVHSSVTYGTRHGNLTFSASVRAFPLRTYADVPKENHGKSLFHADVASCLHGIVRKMALSKGMRQQLFAQGFCRSTKGYSFVTIHVNFSLRLTAMPSQTIRRARQQPSFRRRKDPTTYVTNR